MKDDQRRDPRPRCNGIADVKVLRSPLLCPARILDLSLKGCLVSLREPLDLVKGMIVEIRFTVNQLPFRVRAEVRSLRSATRVGFHFSPPSARIQTRLEELIAELEEDRATRKASLRATAERRGATADTNVA